MPYIHALERRGFTALFDKQPLKIFIKGSYILYGYPTTKQRESYYDATTNFK